MVGKLSNVQISLVAVGYGRYFSCTLAKMCKAAVHMNMACMYIKERISAKLECYPIKVGCCLADVIAWQPMNKIFLTSICTYLGIYVAYLY